MATVPVSKIAVLPARYKYNSKQDKAAERKLVQRLQSHDKFTEVAKLTSPREMFLGSDARINGKQLTTTALSQLCSRLAPGMGQAIRSMTGVQLSSSDDQVAFDDDLAIGLLNSMLKLRFDRLEGYRMIIDHKRKLVEGIVGRRYEFYSNLSLYNRSKAFIQANPDYHVQFCEAALAGRRMMLRFRSTNPLFSIPPPDGREVQEPFFGGFHFANSEVGECSIRAASLLIRQWCDNKAISPFYEDGKLIHVKGVKFEKKLSELLTRTKVKADQAGKFRKNLLAITSIPLGLGGTAGSHKTKRSKLESKLTRKLNKGFARAVVDRLLMSGSYRQDKLTSASDPMKVYAKRTVYDLFNAITYEAKSLSVGYRERAEQLAYQLVSGKFEIKL
jgi:hypothetical protein